MCAILCFIATFLSAMSWHYFSSKSYKLKSLKAKCGETKPRVEPGWNHPQGTTLDETQRFLFPNYSWKNVLEQTIDHVHILFWMGREYIMKMHLNVCTSVGKYTRTDDSQNRFYCILFCRGGPPPKSNSQPRNTELPELNARKGLKFEEYEHNKPCMFHISPIY